jgi:hypothetical protein
MGRINRVVLAGLVVVSAGFTSGARHDVYGIDKDTVINQSVPVTSGQHLQISLETGGTVHITGWDQPVVAVSAKLRGDECPAGKMTVTSDKGVVHVTSRLAAKYGESCSVPDPIEINVPKQFDIQIQSQGGAITIDQVTGQIRGHTDDGSITLSNVGGKLDLSTSAGNVQVQDSHVDGNVNTGSGSVTFVRVDGGVRGRGSDAKTNG